MAKRGVHGEAAAAAEDGVAASRARGEAGHGEYGGALGAASDGWGRARARGSTTGARESAGTARWGERGGEGGAHRGAGGAWQWARGRPMGRRMATTCGGATRSGGGVDVGDGIRCGRPGRRGSRRPAGKKRWGGAGAVRRRRVQSRRRRGEVTEAFKPDPDWIEERESGGASGGGVGRRCLGLGVEGGYGGVGTGRPSRPGGQLVGPRPSWPRGFCFILSFVYLFLSYFF